MSSVRQVALTGDASIDGLMSGVAWVGGVTYSFPAGPGEYGYTLAALAGLPFDETDGFVALGGTPGQPASQAWIATRVFNEFADMIALGITPTAAPGADIRVAMTVTPLLDFFSAYTYYPGTYSEGGDVWFNTTDFNVVVLGSLGHYAFLHEIGHAFGLKHGHEGDDAPYQAVLPFDRNSVEFSVMTYRSYVGAPDDYFAADGHGPQSLMMLDIRALQLMYGADHATRAGNTTYRFDPNTGEMFIDGVAQGISKAAGNVTVNVLFRTVFDGNGTDTYDFSAYDATRQLAIDLRPGEWTDVDSDSNFQASYLGGGPNGGYARGQVANALLINGDERALIENAIGGAGDDSIRGNQANNGLQGRSGVDTLIGLAGDDTLDGGAGDDTLLGGAGNDTLIGGTGTDLADYSDVSGALTVDLARTDAQNTGAGGIDTLSGVESVRGAIGDTTLYGDDRDNRLVGGTGNNLLEGRGGNDTLIGAGFSPTTVSYASAPAGVVVSLLHANQPQDTIGAGLDTLIAIRNLVGSAFADRLTGDAGNSTLDGGAGDDILDGGLGEDLLLGGVGADQAVFAARFADAGFRFEGGRLLVSIAGVTDRLDSIETLVFSDRSVAVSNLASLVTSLKVTTTTAEATGPGLAFVSTPAPDLRITYRGSQLGLTGVTDTTSLLVDTTAANTLLISALGPYGILKVLNVDDADGGELDVSGFVETNLNLGATTDNRLFVSGAMRGSITGGSGTDIMQVGTASDGSGMGNTLRIDAGAGNDRVTAIAPASASSSVLEITGGDGNDVISVTGLSRDILRGGVGDDQLSAGDGDDLLIAGTGTDRLSGGMGTDTAQYSINFAQAQFTWQGSTLLVDDGNGTDTLDGIETLTFNDRTVTVSSLLPQPPPSTTLARITFTNTTATARGPGLSFSVDAPSATPGLAIYNAAQMGITGVTASNDVVVRKYFDGLLEISRPPLPDVPKAVHISDPDGGDFIIRSFLEVATEIGGSRDTTVDIHNAKRGNVVTAAGNDTITMTMTSYTAGSGNTMIVKTGAGEDTVRVAGGIHSLIEVRAGDGTDLVEVVGTVKALLVGDAGDDTLRGGDANDRLKGGAGSDLLFGGAGTDQGLYDINFAQARFTWDGSTLLVDDGAGVDRLTGIEQLVFKDRTVDVATLVGTPPPPPPPPPGPSQVVFTNGTPADTGPGKAFLASPPSPGASVSYTGADMGITGVAAATTATLATDALGALSVRVNTAWNTLKVVKVTDADGGVVTVGNFVEAAITMGGTAASSVTVTETKRGSITTGSGNDTISVSSFSNQSGTGNTFIIDSGAGDDTVSLAAHASGWTIFDVRAGAGADRVTITGRSNDIVQGGDGNDLIDAGAGNDRLTGGTGLDVFVFRAGSGADTVTDFADGTDLLRLEGIAPAAVTIAAATGGVRVSWGADSVTLTGASLPAITAADIVFA